MNVVLDFIVGSLLVVYYVLESWVLFWVPRRFKSKSISGWTALVTGGGSGMGRLLCLELAKRGCRVVTLDVNQAGETSRSSIILAGYVLYCKFIFSMNQWI
jgi:all-trans-retinol dehydrogenase (NAD+)